jgi:hypothetical protein
VRRAVGAFRRSASLGQWVADDAGGYHDGFEIRGAIGSSISK